jgi:outer membrane receptor protein involved in Fe transport
MAGTTGNPELESEPDFKYGFEYDAAENMMVYGSYSSSYRSPNAMAPGGSKAEELDSYSVGAKTRWLDNRLQVNVSAYYYDYTNKLCSGWKEAKDITEEDLGFIDVNGNNQWDPGIDIDYISVGEPDREGNPAPAAIPDGEWPTKDPDNPDENFVFTIHDSQAQGYGAFESFGVDLQTTFLITSRDRLNFSISYLDSEWVDLHFRYEWYMYWPDEDYEGVTPVNSPEWSWTASYEHNFMLGAYGTLTPRVNVEHKSEYTMLWNPGDSDPYGYSRQEGYYTYDASASFSHSSGKWSLNAYVKNITDYAVKEAIWGCRAVKS